MELSRLTEESKVAEDRLAAADHETTMLQEEYTEAQAQSKSAQSTLNFQLAERTHVQEDLEVAGKKWKNYQPGMPIYRLTTANLSLALEEHGPVARRRPALCVAAARRRDRHLDALRRRRAAGALWIALAGALRQYRGVNETISSLLLAYTAIALLKHFVEGPLRDPASLNKPSTRPIDEACASAGCSAPTSTGAWSTACWPACCWPVAVLHDHRLRDPRGRRQRARGAGSWGCRSARMIIMACALGGACAGLAGGIEVTAVHTSANASLIAGLGYAGILVAFVARQNPRRSSRSRCCSAASARPAACCNGAWTCPTHPCWCCRARVRADPGQRGAARHRLARRAVRFKPPRSHRRR